MADQNNSQTVTISDAIEQIKKWAAEKNYEQVKQGCEEILQVEPDNKDAKNLLEEAKKALNPQPAAPIASTAPAAAPSPTEPSPVAPAPARATPSPSAPAPMAAAPAPAPFAPVTAQTSPEDIFKKTTETTKTTTEKSVNVEQAKGLDKFNKEEKKPSEKTGSTAKIITVVIFLLLIGGFVYSFMQGWLNPFYDWILGSLGL